MISDLAVLKSELEEELKRMGGTMHHIDLIFTLLDPTKVDQAIAKDLLEHLKEEETEHLVKLQSLIEKMSTAIAASSSPGPRLETSGDAAAAFTNSKPEGSSQSEDSIKPQPAAKSDLESEEMDSRTLTVGNLFGKPQR